MRSFQAMLLRSLTVGVVVCSTVLSVVSARAIFRSYAKTSGSSPTQSVAPTSLTPASSTQDKIRPKSLRNVRSSGMSKLRARSNQICLLHPYRCLARALPAPLIDSSISVKRFHFVEHNLQKEEDRSPWVVHIHQKTAAENF